MAALALRRSLWSAALRGRQCRGVVGLAATDMSTVLDRQAQAPVRGEWVGAGASRYHIGAICLSCGGGRAPAASPKARCLPFLFRQAAAAWSPTAKPFTATRRKWMG